MPHHAACYLYDRAFATNSACLVQQEIYSGLQILLLRKVLLYYAAGVHRRSIRYSVAETSCFHSWEWVIRQATVDWNNRIRSRNAGWFFYTLSVKLLLLSGLRTPREGIANGGMSGGVFVQMRQGGRDAGLPEGRKPG